MARTLGMRMRKAGQQVVQPGQEKVGEENRRRSRREKMPTSTFSFEGNHTLFSATTRRCEEKKEKRGQNVERQKRFQSKKKENKLKEQVKELKKVIKKQEKKIATLSKKTEKK